MSGQHRHDPERYALAGEYVLGILSGEQRRQFEQQLAKDQALQTALAQWEERLHPLTELASPQAPSSRLWPRIERSLDALTQARTAVASPGWWQRLGVWRGLTAASLAMSVLLAALLVSRAQPEPSYIVVLAAPENLAPGWVVQTQDLNEVQLIPLAAMEVPAGQVLEFWTKADDWNRPVSLGLVEPGKRMRVAVDELPPLAPNQLFELTLEQAGGSPTGLPTGPIQFIGRAVKI